MSYSTRQKPTAAPGLSSQDRDRQLEETYSFHRQYPKQSLTEHVAQNRDELSYAFFDWQVVQGFAEDDEAMLIRFEEEKFGRALEPVAHAMLLFAIKYRKEHMRAPEDSNFNTETQRIAVEEAALSVEPIEGEGMEARVRRIAIAAGLILPDAPKAKIVREWPKEPEKPVPVELREVRLPYRDDTNDPVIEPKSQSEPETLSEPRQVSEPKPVSEPLESEPNTSAEDDDVESLDWLDDTSTEDGNG